MSSKEIEKLLATVRDHPAPEYLIAHEHEPLISVGDIISRAARYYEKARYSVEYKEEHLLRRTAIGRILRRRLVIDFVQEKSGRAFLTELIQAGYLSNNQLPERASVPIQAIIDKTVFFVSLLEHTYDEDDFSRLRSLALRLATAEIDECLFPSVISDATAKALYRTVRDHVTIAGSNMNKDEHDVQTYLACRRGLLKDDDVMLFYKLWLSHYPEWTDLNHPDEETDERLKQIAEEFAGISAMIEEQLKSPIHQRLVPRLKNDIIYFSIIRKIIERYGDAATGICDDPERLSFTVREIADEEYARVGARMKKSAWRAIIYIFITKTLLALSVELPYDMIVENEIHYFALAVNVIFHPILLFFMTAGMARPSSNNTARIMRGVHSIVLGGNGHDEIILHAKKKRSAWNMVAGTLYTALFFSLFGVIIWGLARIGFNVAGIGFFVFFLTFVSYFGLRIRFIARQWVVRTNEQRFFSFLWDLLTLPIISLGRWLTIKFASINIFVFILDFIIEAPFKVILQALDTFALFVKEKKDEIY